jgi:hypothetical protein
MDAVTNTELNIRLLKYTSETAKLKLTLNFLNKHSASSDEYKTISIFTKGNNCNNDTGISLPNITDTVYAEIISICLERITELLNRIKHKFRGMTKYRKCL